jgi:hypothetical protein
MKPKAIKTRENRESFRRYCRALSSRYGSPEGYGWNATHWGYIAGHAWRKPDLSLHAAVDITRDRKSPDDASGEVLVTIYK